VSLNLISDNWIPVITKDGQRRSISPYDLLDRDLVMVDWDRPDFNLASLEFLIGLAYAACAPEDLEDWEDGLEMTSTEWSRGLDRLVPAFHLLGDGPRFAQDLDPLDDVDPTPCDGLFFETAGDNTIKNNSDIFVHRGRYASLDLPEAAMALFVTQIYAGSGGVGFRVGLRGGGPLTVLIDPSETLWDLVWANVPYGTPASPSDLPWMNPCRSSAPAAETKEQKKARLEAGEKREKPKTVVLGSGKTPEHEVFFSMPRRIRLIAEGGVVTGFRHKTYGTDYEECLHPLSGYYRTSKTSGLISRKVNFPRFGYDNWIGTTVPGAKAEAKEQAQCLRQAPERYPGEALGVILGGWNLNKSTASNFLFARTVLHQIHAGDQVFLRGMIEAAVTIARSIEASLMKIDKVPYGMTIPHSFYDRTARRMDRLYARLAAGEDRRAIGRDWFDHLREVGLALFDELTSPLYHSLRSTQLRGIMWDRQKLEARLSTRGASGAKLRALLEMDEEIAA